MLLGLLALLGVASITLYGSHAARRLRPDTTG